MFRFTIRDVLWLTVVVGLAIGWCLDHRATAQRVTRLRFIATKLADDLNGRDDLEVKVVNDHLFCAQARVNRRHLIGGQDRLAGSREVVNASLVAFSIRPSHAPNCRSAFAAGNCRRLSTLAR